MLHENLVRAQNQRDADTPQSIPAFSRVDVALLMLLAALLAIFFWRILTPNPLDRAQFPPGDFTDQFYAFRLYEARALAEGRIPLWSENFNSGHPFLADIQSAVFYPIALGNTLLNVALFNSFSLFALELEALLHFYLAGAFTYLFARRAIKNRAGAFVSAIVFMFGGYLTSYPSLQLAILETAVWLPLALFCIDMAITDDRRQTADDSAQSVIQHWRWVIAAGMVLGVAALAGHPQTFLFVFVTTIIYFLFRVWQNAKQSKIENRKSKIWIRTIGAIVMLALLAFGIAAIQLVPAIEYQQLSTREALSFAEAAKGFPTLEILQFILPGYTNAFASPLYVGILPLWLAIFALFGRLTTDGGRQKREVVFWGLLALGALILAFGFYVFAYVIFYLFVPGASLFRQQERLAFVVSFALAMLAGYGMANLLRQDGAGAFDVKRAKKLFLLLPAGAVILFVLLLTFFIAGAGVGYNATNPQPRLAFLGDRAGLLLLQFVLASLLVGLYLKKFLSARVLTGLAIFLILFDLWSVNEPANKGRVDDRFANIPFLEQLKSDPDIFRVAADEQLLPGHFGIVAGLEEIGGISPLRLANYQHIFGLPSAAYWRLLNLKYLITQSPFPEADTIAQDQDAYLLQVPQAMPRAWMVGKAEQGNDSVMFEKLAAAGAEAAQYAVVAEALPFVVQEQAAQAQVAIAARAAERMTLDVNTPADGLLIISENFYPGWRATVDGEPTEILRANLTLRAVPIRAGQHRVEMWYDPWSFKIGAVISAVTVLGCVLFLLWKRSTFKRLNVERDNV